MQIFSQGSMDRYACSWNQHTQLPPKYDGLPPRSESQDQSKKHDLSMSVFQELHKHMVKQTISMGEKRGFNPIMNIFTKLGAQAIWQEKMTHLKFVELSLCFEMGVHKTQHKKDTCHAKGTEGAVNATNLVGDNLGQSFEEKTHDQKGINGIPETAWVPTNCQAVMRCYLMMLAATLYFRKNGILVSRTSCFQGLSGTKLSS